MMNQPASSTAALLGHVTHVPVKEGLHSIIKCLKNQDLTFSSREFCTQHYFTLKEISLDEPSHLMNVEMFK
jgi:hypothetical protein